MKAHVLKGTKQEIAENIARINGDVREAIVFEEEPATASSGPTGNGADIFAEMRPFMVDVPDIDDSREAIYSQLDGE